VVRLPAPVRPLFPYLKPAYTAFTRAAAPVTVAVARRRGTGLPTGSVATTEEAAARSGGRCVPARPAETLVRPHLPGGPAAAVFAADRVERLPRTVVAELPGGRVLGPHRAVVTGTGELVQDLSFYFGTRRPREHPLFLHPFPPPPTEVAGRLGVLATRGDLNYYHFLVDVLPRLAVLDAAGVAPPQRWYVPASTGFQRELLDLAGVPESARIDADAVPHVRAETLVVPSPPSMTVINPPWVTGYLRSLLLPAGLRRVPGRGVYVTRGASANNRTVTNEAELLPALTARGFVPVEPGAMTVSEQIRTFAEADVVVAPHGAALANLVFASPGATVVELFPADAAVSDYWKLASGVPGLRYSYALGLRRDGSASGRVHRTAAVRQRLLVSDVTVDVPALCRLLDGLCGRQATGPQVL